MLKKYFTKTKEFFNILFGNTKENLDNELLKYENELREIYNNLIFSFEKLYSDFYGKKLQIAPLMPLIKDYGNLFSENIRKDFDIYREGKSLVAKRKNLENKLFFQQ